MKMRTPNGRGHFWQWDAGQKITVVGDETCGHALLSNVPNGTALRVPIVDEGGVRTVAVPDILLQQAEPIVVHLCQCGEDGTTTTNHSQRFPVLARAKPADYVYTPEEIKTWDDLAQRVTTLEQSGLPTFGPEYEGRLLYVLNGALAPAEMGTGLEFVGGVLRLTGATPEPGGDGTTAVLGTAKIGIMILGRSDKS